ncbi:MAG: hypothetical protein SF339_14865 [Blastocatellia bacterium]|nr:hypothetical protein [Blastocatellia bacterium]
MSFILRAVLILLIFSFVVYVFKAIARLSFNLKGALKEVRTIRANMDGRPMASAEMKRCAACGAFVAARDALTVSSRNQAQTFCSRECLQSSVAKTS